MFKKLHYLRHPYLIRRALLRPLEHRDSKNHRLRLGEYVHFSTSLEEAMGRLFGIETDEIVRLRKKLESSGFPNYIKSCLSQIEREPSHGGMGGEHGLMLYLAVRLLHPDNVVETGVANGISSSFILEALSEIGSGRHYSIDLDCREGVAVPPEKKLGWVIPQELRDRWSLMLGESAKVLPRLLKDLGFIDIFLHDSRHLYGTMMNEYSITWPYLREGGLLLSDDVVENDAFIDFADKVKMHLLLVGRMGAIAKVNSVSRLSNQES